MRCPEPRATEWVYSLLECNANEDARRLEQLACVMVRFLELFCALQCSTFDLSMLCVRR